MELSQGTEAMQLAECRLAQQHLTMQYAVSCTLVEASTIDEAATRTLQVIGEGQGWEVGNLWRLDTQASVLRCSATWHASSSTTTLFEIISKQMQFTQGIGLPGRVWATGEPVWISNVQEESNFPRFKLAQRTGVQGAFAFPIRGSSGFLGVIEFFSSEIRSLQQKSSCLRA
jgi:GAF domain-containing protein